MATSSRATQDFVPIKEIRDGVVVLKDGSLRALMIASSINLSLKSADEQRAVLANFQTFLNSVDFSIQISIQSRRLDIRPYLLTLEERMKEQLEPLLKIQTKEYIDFIRSFTEQISIMTKTFVIVVPYANAPLSEQGSLTKKFFGSSSTGNAGKDKLIEFEEQRTQLEQRMAVIEQGLARVGVRTVKLGTEEAVELYYKIFNPGETSGNIKLDDK